MVVTFLPGDVAEIGVTQERTGLPSTCTVQAPHCADAAAELGAGEAEVVAQHPEQRRVGRLFDQASLPLTTNLIIECSSSRGN